MHMEQDVFGTCGNKCNRQMAPTEGQELVNMSEYSTDHLNIGFQAVVEDVPFFLPLASLNKASSLNPFQYSFPNFNLHLLALLVAMVAQTVCFHTLLSKRFVSFSPVAGSAALLVVANSFALLYLLRYVAVGILPAILYLLREFVLRYIAPPQAATVSHEATFDNESLLQQQMSINAPRMHLESSVQVEDSGFLVRLSSFDFSLKEREEVDRIINSKSRGPPSLVEVQASAMELEAPSAKDMQLPAGFDKAPPAHQYPADFVGDEEGAGLHAFWNATPSNTRSADSWMNNFVGSLVKVLGFFLSCTTSFAMHMSTLLVLVNDLPGEWQSMRSGFILMCLSGVSPLFGVPYTRISLFCVVSFAIGLCTIGITNLMDFHGLYRLAALFLPLLYIWVSELFHPSISSAVTLKTSVGIEGIGVHALGLITYYVVYMFYTPLDLLGWSNSSDIACCIILAFSSLIYVYESVKLVSSLTTYERCGIEVVRILALCVYDEIYLAIHGYTEARRPYGIVAYHVLKVLGVCIVVTSICVLGSMVKLMDFLRKCFTRTYNSHQVTGDISIDYRRRRKKALVATTAARPRDFLSLAAFQNMPVDFRQFVYANQADDDLYF